MKAKFTIALYLMISLATLTMATTSNDSYRWLYAKAFNGMNSTEMTVDSRSNTYFYGFSFNDVKYDDHTTTIDYASERGAIIIMKINAQQEYQWTKKVNVLTANSDASFNVRTMDVDDNGNMYFGGDFSDAITVLSQTYDMGDSQGYFLMKTDSIGNIQWFKAGSESRGTLHTVKYTAGRVAFVCGWIGTDTPELFGTNLSEIYENVENYVDCDMMVGLLSPTDGHIIYAQGLKTQHTTTYDQLYGLGTILYQINNLEADTHGNLYVSGGFNSNTLTVAGVEYQTEQDLGSTTSQFILRMDVYGGISWVKLLTNASGYYPSLAVNNESGVAALFPGKSNTLYIDDKKITVTGDATKYNYIALFNLSNGDLMTNQRLNSQTINISPSLNGGFCVTGNLKANGQYFGIDGLYNPDTLRENLFVGFLDKDLNMVAGQAVISFNMYIPKSIKTGADGKIRLLGAVNFNSENDSAAFSFGDYKVSQQLGNNLMIYSELDPHQLLKGRMDAYPSDCNRYEFFVETSLNCKYEWYVNGKLNGTDFGLTSNTDWGGYEFATGTNYVTLVLTDSTDNSNTITLRDTVNVYEPIININTEIFPDSGLVNYNVTVSNYAPNYRIAIDRGNYNYDTTEQAYGSYTYEPGEQTIKVILSTDDNWNCFYNAEKTFTVPEPSTSEDCNEGAIRGHVESTIAQFLAGEIQVDLFEVTDDSVANQYIMSDTIDDEGLFSLDNLPEGRYILRANVINAENYPQLLVTYFNEIINQVTSWQEATPIILSCNQIADLNLTFAAIMEAMNGTGSISGIISYSTQKAVNRSTLRATSAVGETRINNVPMLLRRKSNQEIVARTTTDENGLYQFDNLLDDEYEIIVDIPGVAMKSTYTVTLSASQDEAKDRNFIVSNSGINTNNQFAIVASISGNGSINNIGTTMVNIGESYNYTFTPDDGYTIEDVLVNAQSIGKVSEYKFENIESNQSIQVLFLVSTLNPDLEHSELNVYPQIIQDYVQVQNCTKESNITIFNQIGQSIYSSLAKTNNLKINSSAWAKGFYLIRVSDSQARIKTFKVVKY